jgi:hypothetical protein
MRLVTNYSCSFSLILLFLNVTSSLPAEEAKSRFFELRTYTTAPGKLDALHKRFDDHTNKLFVKHGMELVGYWTPADGEKARNTLVYILAYPDRASRDKSWKAFLSDPVWKKAFKESRKDGPIVTKVKSQYLNPTEYSLMK